jgi:AcrR family transcriptional regulator
VKAAAQPLGAEDSRARIHAVALALLARHGYEGVSLQMIADGVGLHKSTLFHHYGSKIELALEVLAGVLERVVSRLRPLGHEGQPAIDTLIACTEALVDHFSDEPDGARLLMAFITAPSASELKQKISPEVDALDREFFGLIIGWLDRARKAGTIRKLNVRQAVFNLMALTLFYPATATDFAGGLVAGPEPFSPAARRVRKRELAIALRGILG